MQSACRPAPVRYSFAHSANRFTPCPSNWIRVQSLPNGDPRKSRCISSSVRWIRFHSSTKSMNSFAGLRGMEIAKQDPAARSQVLVGELQQFPDEFVVQIVDQTDTVDQVLRLKPQ